MNARDIRPKEANVNKPKMIPKGSKKRASRGRKENIQRGEEIYMTGDKWNKVDKIKWSKESCWKELCT